MNAKWLFGLFASLIVLAVSTTIAQTVSLERRLSTLEEAKANSKEELKDFKREVREDLKDIQAKTERISQAQSEQIALLRELTTRKK